MFSTLKEELDKLTRHQKRSLIRKVAVHEDDKQKIGEIFERINDARQQLMVSICMVISRLITSIVQVAMELRVHQIVHAIQEDLAVRNLTVLRPR